MPPIITITPPSFLMEKSLKPFFHFLQISVTQMTLMVPSKPMIIWK